MMKWKKCVCVSVCVCVKENLSIGHKNWTMKWFKTKKKHNKTLNCVVFGRNECHTRTFIAKSQLCWKSYFMKFHQHFHSNFSFNQVQFFARADWLWWIIVVSYLVRPRRCSFFISHPNDHLRSIQFGTNSNHVRNLKKWTARRRKNAIPRHKKTRQLSELWIPTKNRQLNLFTIQDQLQPSTCSLNTLALHLVCSTALFQSNITMSFAAIEVLWFIETMPFRSNW